MRNAFSTVIRSSGTFVSGARPRRLAPSPLLRGCGNIEPWVKPYERQALADPIMSFDPNPVSTRTWTTCSKRAKARAARSAAPAAAAAATDAHALALR